MFPDLISSPAQSWEKHAERGEDHRCYPRCIHEAIRKTWDNRVTAVREFAEKQPGFSSKQPAWP